MRRDPGNDIRDNSDLPRAVCHVPLEGAERYSRLSVVPETRHCREEGEMEHLRVSPVVFWFGDGVLAMNEKGVWE